MTTRGMLFAILLSIAASGVSAGAANSGLDLNAIAGVYSYSFDNTAGDDHYRAENTLKIVPRSPTQAYVEVYLEFVNGHSCEVAGIADVRGRALLYDSHRLENGSYCRLAFEVDRRTIRLADPGNSCRFDLCSARGYLDGAHFSRAARRPVRGMAQLRGSQAYIGALKEYAAAHPAR